MATLDDAVKLLECPVCYEHLRPPIQTCENGHGICGICRKLIKTCPICRKNYTNIANTLLNQLIERMTFKCKYNLQGCDKLIRFSSENHEKICSYRIEKCIKCRTESPYYKINDHLKVCCMNGGKLETAFSTMNTVTGFLTEKETNRYLLVYVTNVQRYFVLRFIDNRKKIHFCVQYTGNDQENVEKYKFELRIIQDSFGSYRSWTGICEPYVSSIEETKEQKRCIELDLKSIYVTREVFQTKKFQYEITLSEVKEPNSKTKNDSFF